MPCLDVLSFVRIATGISGGDRIMTIKSILCAYSGEQAKDSVLDYAIQLAHHHHAWLTGIVRHGYSKMERRISTIVADEIHRVLHEAEMKRIREVISRFHDRIEASGLGDRASYIDLEPDMRFSISQIARTYDLVVTGHHPDDDWEDFLAAYPDRLALQSGRPVLVVPDGYKSDKLASRAVVAWDGKRSAARAIGEAMTILEEKAKVVILTVGESHTVDDHPDGGILRLLERHGIEAEHIHNQGRGKSIAGVIEQTAANVGAELIVMGAFEHSKFQHDLFGGVTTDIIKNGPVPVFMSH